MPKPNAKPAAPATVPQINIQGKSQLSKLQQQFNTKIRKIERLKQQLAQREESMRQVQKRVHTELQPLVRQLADKRAALAHLLDEAYALPFFRKREKEKLALLIEDITFELINRHGRSDLTELHDKYAELSFEESINQAEEDAKDMAENLFRNVFGVEVDMDNPDAFEDLQAQLEREMEQREQEKQQRQKTRKTKAQLAKEEKAKVELSNISKASRRVYTDLAKRLHPDAEQDPQARAWKEEAMKRVTQAYHHDDFFELLRLQLEFMQEQHQPLDSLPEEQLAYYIKLLNEQLRELQDAQDGFSFSPDAGLYHRFGGTPRQMDQKFKRAKEELQLELQQLHQDLKTLQDPQQLRQLLKELK